jgi:hypothetical protein
MTFRFLIIYYRTPNDGRPTRPDYKLVEAQTLTEALDKLKDSGHKGTIITAPTIEDGVDPSDSFWSFCRRHLKSRVGEFASPHR